MRGSGTDDGRARRFGRRRVLAVGGAVGLSGLIAACSSGRSPGPGATEAATTPDVPALLTRAPQCVAIPEQTQGPYWFDVDSIRNDIREGRPGSRFDLVVRVQDTASCTPQGGGAIPNAVVELWHCDASGAYSGFESSSRSANDGAPPEQAPAPGKVEVSHGSYSEGNGFFAPTDHDTFLRGAQVTDGAGVVRFTTVFPGWYTGRTTHIHLKVHIDRQTVRTTQLYFDEALIDAIYATDPYNLHTGRERNVTNATDAIFDPLGLVTVVPTADGHLGAVNIVV
ncbi:intradiol ring-cleavage dioxygenase [Rhodococcus sp. D2-41]|uniref:Intradiol ring-cleavage dioxygenase n=1 Tax=Speluncibacter jeojiensis TaxID=2710754 RepID=A0A9X4LZ73_9ACTN|nr:intradiol ring-cleavage dioxygenase [Rhodococcus sp. D2-41]MDG3010359.1 intradiol ring-cleavage dioxygenase [Rhodococcus sp. D2-41]MDG3014095.1 intradiol ring-cleavage dioxygenase [Corynebacteriales bacterium D3-21]